MNKNTYLGTRVIVEDSALRKLSVRKVNLLNQTAIVLKDTTEQEPVIRIISESEFQDVCDNLIHPGTTVIDLETLDARVKIIGVDYFNYKANYKSTQRILISKGFLTALLDSYCSSKKAVNEAIICFLSLEDNNYPLRQLSRYRQAFNVFVKEFIADMAHIFSNNTKAIYQQLAFMLGQYFTDAYLLLKSKTTMFDSILCDKLAESLRKLVKTTAPDAVKHIVKKICGQYLPSFCPH